MITPRYADGTPMSIELLYVVLKAMRPAARRAHLATLDQETLERLQALHATLNPLALATVLGRIRKGNQS